MFLSSFGRFPCGSRVTLQLVLLLALHNTNQMPSLLLCMVALERWSFCNHSFSRSINFLHHRFLKAYIFFSSILFTSFHYTFPVVSQRYQTDVTGSFADLLWWMLHSTTSFCSSSTVIHWERCELSRSEPLCFITVWKCMPVSRF